MDAKTTYVEAVDGQPIFTRIWHPSNELAPKAIIHILHGMAEHSKRYTDTAQHFAKAGYLVVAHDHRGHGERAIREDELGHYGEDRSWGLVLADVHSVNQHARSLHHGLPVFICGHSMGSFITLGFAQKHSALIDGVILSGSAYPSSLTVQSANRVARLERLRQGAQGRSKLMDFLTFSSFNKPFKKNARTDFDWLSREDHVVDAYLNDPKCSFICTNQTWVELTNGIIDVFSNKQFSTLPTDIPYYVFSGSLDPVGNKGKDIGRLLTKLNEIGVKSLAKRIYEDGRHEMLNESNRHEVIGDLHNWVDEQVGKIDRKQIVAA